MKHWHYLLSYFREGVHSLFFFFLFLFLIIIDTEQCVYASDEDNLQVLLLEALATDTPAQ